MSIKHRTGAERFLAGLKPPGAAALALPFIMMLVLAGCPTGGGGGGGNGNGTGSNPVAGELKTLTLSGVAVPMRYVPAGKFQRNGYSWANVSVITKGYWLAETETTQELFEAVMGRNPSGFDGTSGKEAAAEETQNKRPVEKVNWYHAIAFCNKLSIANGKQAVYSVKVNEIERDWANLTYDQVPTGSSGNSNWDAATMDTSKNGYRLPTEMEWMWAAMGADKTEQPNTIGYAKAFAGDSGSSSNIRDFAWYWTNSNGSDRTHEVGKKTANELGLKDMAGNVQEWCWDWYDSGIPGGELTDFTGVDRGVLMSNCVVRGGDWSVGAAQNAMTYREGFSRPAQYDFLGFRFVCP